MFVRKKINSSGSISVQILEKTNRTNKLIQTVGSSKNEIEIERLYNRAFEIIDQLKQQSRFNFYSNQDESILNFTQQLSNSNIQAVGSQLIFGKLFDSMGFNAIDNKLFKDLVLSRIIYQGSKLKLTEYLKRYENKSISIQRIYRFLDKVHSSYKEQAEDIAFLHTKKVLKNITVVFYDMTTLYFESGDEDDFRKIGFSKDGKFQNPQIMLGLLVGEYGYPIGYELFEGNTFEGHTLIPVLEKFQKRFNLINPAIVIGRVGALCGNVHKVMDLSWISDNALILSVNTSVFSFDYVSLCLGARNLNTLADKNAQPLITGTKVTNEHIPIPPINEQRVIEERVIGMMEQFEILSSKAETGITLLKERRTALISAAVTGKIDVRNWGVPRGNQTNKEVAA